ncbi:MAG: histidinol-phosphatase [Aristaeellaceae bacterium]
MKCNYHTHTTRCFHARGLDEDYVQAAMDAGFDLLGFADHAPWPFANGFVSGIRMGMAELPGYIASVKSLQAQYADRLPILLGLESEYFPRYHDHLLRMRDMGITYYVLGQHYADSEEDTPYTGIECETDEGVLRYAEATVKAIRTGLFLYVAHPDLFMRHRTAEQFNRACETASDMICQAAKEQGMPIEYNLLGLRSMLDGNGRGYPSAPFWQYARKYDNDVIIGVDAHDPAQLRDTELWQTAVGQVKALGYHLLDSLVIPE